MDDIDFNHLTNEGKDLEAQILWVNYVSIRTFNFTNSLYFVTEVNGFTCEECESIQFIWKPRLYFRGHIKVLCYTGGYSLAYYVLLEMLSLNQRKFCAQELG
ncbi:hypothetical protein PIB30_086611 [Stylosanthes scabra]|uniref:Uncharacterized protein n=1 Tax=Stylosanthes scabra TaxID=79078 RepID=A0ABU6QSQ5_9FABA|nr:hypothetical protein [Stylosanthes scabra]